MGDLNRQSAVGHFFKNFLITMNISDDFGKTSKKNLPGPIFPHIDGGSDDDHFKKKY